MGAYANVACHSSGPIAPVRLSRARRQAPYICNIGADRGFLLRLSGAVRQVCRIGKRVLRLISRNGETTRRLRPKNPGTTRRFIWRGIHYTRPHSLQPTDNPGRSNKTRQTRKSARQASIVLKKETNPGRPPPEKREKVNVGHPI